MSEDTWNELEELFRGGFPIIPGFPARTVVGAGFHDVSNRTRPTKDSKLLWVLHASDGGVKTGGFARKPRSSNWRAVMFAVYAVFHFFTLLKAYLSK